MTEIEENPFIKYHNWLTSLPQETLYGYEKLAWLDQKKEAPKEPIYIAFPNGRNELPEPDWSKKPICVNGISGTGRSFLSQIISCHPTLGGEDFMKEMVKTIDQEHFVWTAYVHKYNLERIVRTHSDDVDFDEVEKYYKFVHIPYDGTEEETNFLKKRLMYIVHTRMTRNYGYSNLIVKYNRVFQEFLRNSHKKHFEFPLLHFEDTDKFCDTSIKMFEYLELEPLDKKIIKKLFGKWVLANTKHYQNFIIAAKKFKDGALPKI